MKPGLYSAKFNRKTKQLEPSKLIMSGLYRRKKSGHFFWHMLTLDKTSVVLKGRCYCLVFPLKKDGLLYSFLVEAKADYALESYGVRILPQ